MSYPEIFLLRHGQTQWNKEGRWQGQHDSTLTPLGRRQAEQQGQILRAHLSHFDQFDWLASPLGRVRETAAIALTGTEVEIRFDPNLAEIGLGEQEGKLHHEVTQIYPEFGGENRFAALFSIAGGENWPDFEGRIREVLESLTRPTVIFTHGMVGHVIRGLSRGLDFDGICALHKNGQRAEQGVVQHLVNGQDITLRAQSEISLTSVGI